MEAHVTGHPELGQLRQALTAVFAGNPLFSPAEQLQLRHAAHACDDVATLMQQLRRAQREAWRRPLVAAQRPRYDRRTTARASAARRFSERRQLLESGLASRRECRRYLHPFPYLSALQQLQAVGNVYLGMLARFRCLDYQQAALN